MSELIIGVSGVRGILDDSLDSCVAERLARAYAVILGEPERVILARDSRPSGAEFARTVGKALVGMGFEAFPIPSLLLSLLSDKLLSVSRQR